MTAAAVRILELRSVWGTGGGPDKTILLGTARTDRSRYAITVCYIRDARDQAFGITAKARDLDIDYRELVERHSFDPSIWPRLRQLVREQAIDIVHTHDLKTDVLGLPLARAEGAIALATVHGWSGESRKERLYYAVEKRLLARYPRLVAVSRPIRDELIRHGARPERVITVLNGIDHLQVRRDHTRERDARARLGIEPGTFVIGSIGRLEPQKRFDLLIDAVARLREHHPHVRCFIAGDGSLRQALTVQIDRLGLRDACVLLGHQHDVQSAGNDGGHHECDEEAR
jgi:glycosyltransferase involved in cell wall biosynthesis